MFQEEFDHISFRLGPILCNAGPSSFGTSTLSIILQLEKETNGYSSVFIIFVTDKRRIKAISEYDSGFGKEVNVSFPMSMYTGLKDLISSPNPTISYYSSLEHEGSLVFHGTRYSRYSRLGSSRMTSVLPG